MKRLVAWAIAGAYIAALIAMLVAGIWTGDERWVWTGLVFLLGSIVIVPPLALLHDPDNN